ncbi:hypothetical protein [Agrobacterium pusense]|uniref:hypothetical protein n=1 Tax=Agrobacterium pusense TaxID=648995 RepID=UPI0028968AEB|nr:hypothetical protein [Agrobacterium pusense]
MLRGLAAVCVAYSHLALKMHNRGDTDGVTRALFDVTKVFLDVGKFGVIVLFALGGYFILSSLQMPPCGIGNRLPPLSCIGFSIFIPPTGCHFFSAC